MPPSAAVLNARLLGRARLRHLQLLVAIADHGTLRRAAEHVGMSQPAATQAIGELERLLEVPLFERQARGMRASQAGQAVLPVVRQILEALEVAIEAMAARQAGASGLLRIGAIPAAVQSLLAPALRTIVERHPRLRLQIVEGTPAHLLNELAAGGLHVLLSRPPAGLGSRFAFDSLSADEAILVASPRHPLAGRARLSLDELAQYPWMVPPVGVKVRALFDELVATNPPIRVHPVSTSSPELVLAVLGDDRTVVLGPSSLAQAYMRHGLVVQLALRAPLPIDGLGAVYPVASRNEPSLVAFLDALRASADRASAPCGSPARRAPRG